MTIAFSDSGNVRSFPAKPGWSIVMSETNNVVTIDIAQKLHFKYLKDAMECVEKRLKLITETPSYEHT